MNPTPLPQVPQPRIQQATPSKGLALPSIPGLALDPRLGAFLNVVRQRMAYASPEQRAISAGAYRTAVGAFNPVRPQGMAGFGGPAPKWRQP